MTKLVSDNQEGGLIGEDEFRLWASKFGWYADKFSHDYGLDFVCQVRGKRVGEKSAEMPGNLLTVSVRSTAADGNAIKITRDDAKLLFSTNTPMVFAIVRRASQNDPAQIAIKFPDEAFIGELEVFLRSAAKSYQVRFTDAVTEVDIIRGNAERLLKEPYADYLTRLRVKLRLEEFLADPKVEIIHTEGGSYGIVRSRDFETPLEVSERPDIVSST